MPPTIRAMTAADTEAGLRLCRASRWNQVAADWACFLDVPGAGCLLAEIGPTPVGTVAFRRYGSAFAWVAMMLVDPAYRRQGVGARLMDAVLDELCDTPCVRLDATPQGEPLYRRLGFLPESELLRAGVTVEPERFPLADLPARPIQTADLPRVFACDGESFGAGRAGLLASFYERAPQYAWMVVDGATIAGYCFGRPGHLYHHIGPILADRIGIARALLSHCLAPHPGRAFAVDIPRHAPDWLAWLESAGFAVERPLLRMYRGRPPCPHSPGRHFAIAGPEFG